MNFWFQWRRSPSASFGRSGHSPTSESRSRSRAGAELCRSFVVGTEGVIYLVFNEGYTATAGDDQMRPALCEDAAAARADLGRARHRWPAEVHGLVAAHGNPGVAVEGARRVGRRAYRPRLIKIAGFGISFDPSRFQRRPSVPRNSAASVARTHFPGRRSPHVTHERTPRGD